MFTGSIAGIHYGVPRFTHDLDVVVNLQAQHIAALKHDLAGAFYFDEEAAVEAVAQQEQFNIVHLTSFFKVDFWPLQDSEFARLSFERRRKVSMLGTEVWLISPEDLVLSKLLWHEQSDSEVQWRDVIALVRAPSLTVDRSYLTEWAKRLGLSPLLERLLAAAQE